MEHNRKGIAFRTRISSSFSEMITPEQDGHIHAKIASDNSHPVSVWSGVFVSTDLQEVRLSYVEDCTKIHCDWESNGSVMPSSLFSEQGALIGLSKLDGVIPGCEEYHGVVTYIIKAE